MFKSCLFQKYQVRSCYSSQDCLMSDHSQWPIYMGLTPWPLLWVIQGHMRSNGFLPKNNQWGAQCDAWHCSMPYVKMSVIMSSVGIPLHLPSFVIGANTLHHWKSFTLRSQIMCLSDWALYQIRYNNCRYNCTCSLYHRSGLLSSD